VDPEFEPAAERERTPVPHVRSPERSGGALERATGAIGNRGFSQVIARMRDGEGILPNGVVHPDVEAAISAARGGGSPLDRELGGRLEAAMGESFGDVRVHTDEHADALARAVSARAFTVGNDVFFGAGEYAPGSHAGAQLISHEVAHVVQQRGAPVSGPLTVSQPGDALERDAEAIAHDFTG
jgi:hypothetical protein